MEPIMGGQPLLQFSSAGTNIIFDGNSLVECVYMDPSNGVVAKTAALPPLNGAISIRNTGKSGQDINDMRYRATDQVDAFYAQGKKNVLITWEGTNAIFNNGFSGATAAAQMALYNSERLALHPDWIIVMLTTLPRFSAGNTFTIAQGNAELDIYDAYLKANFKQMGAKKVIDVRAAGIFTYTGPTVNSTMAPYMIDPIHYNASGGPVLAQYVADGIKRLPAR